MLPFQKRDMVRGDSLAFDLALTNPNTGAPLDLTGAKLWFTAKNNYVDADNLAVIALDSAALGGITITSIPQGKATVLIPPIATRAMPDGVVKLVYDVQVKDASGFITTIEMGSISIYPDVTRSIA